MQRKKLLALPVPTLETDIVISDTVLEERRNHYNSMTYTYNIHNYIYKASVDLSTGEEILIIDLYKPSGPHIWRYFLDSKGAYFSWITADERISKAGMDYLLGGFYYSNYMSDNISKKAIYDFLEIEESKERNPLDEIVSVNCNHKEFKLKIKLDKIRKSIDNQMLEIRELPKAVHEWVDRDLMKFSRYIFYDYQPRKMMSGYCTHCKSDVQVEKPKHKEQGKCPNCKSPITFIALGKYQRGSGFDDNSSFAYFQKTKKGFCLRIFYTKNDFGIRSFKNYKSVRTATTETYRVFYDYSELNGFRFHKAYEYGNFRQTGEYRFYDSYGSSPENNFYKIYPSNLNQI